MLKLLGIAFFLLVSLPTGAHGTSQREKDARCSHINRHTLSEYDCSHVPFCQKTYNISYLNMLPYAPSQGIQEFLHLCCGNCTKWRVTDIFQNISDVSPNSINQSHFAYPFLGKLSPTITKTRYKICCQVLMPSRNPIREVEIFQKKRLDFPKTFYENYVTKPNQALVASTFLLK